MVVPEKKNDEEEGNDDDENRPMVLNTRANPEHVLLFQCSDEFLNQRIKNLKEEDIQGTHYNENDMKRRLEAYRKLNKEGTGQPIMLDFFREHKIDVRVIKIENNQNKIFEQCRSFVERVTSSPPIPRTGGTRTTTSTRPTEKPKDSSTRSTRNSTTRNTSPCTSLAGTKRNKTSGNSRKKSTRSSRNTPGTTKENSSIPEANP